MNLTDFYFLIFFVVCLTVYYIVPRKMQWMVLLIGSAAFYLMSGSPVLILYPLCSIVITYLCAGHIRSRYRLAAGVICLLLVLTLVKYVRNLPVSFEILVPLGLSYYTFTLISYLVDVYNGIAAPADSFRQFLAFAFYTPSYVSGPIMQYRMCAESFREEHTFDPGRIVNGAQRILWGFFKKLVIAERLSAPVAAIYAYPDMYGGYVWIAVFCFTVQLYADFSGLMDIVLGISECFGLRLPENFSTPFFSQTISELWRRWHITLGVWFKEYVFYPIMRTKTYLRMNSALNNKLGKKTGKRLSTYAAMLVLWLTVGLWHGGDLSFVIGSGLLQWVYIVLEDVLEAPFKKMWKRLNIDPAHNVLKGVRMVRTFVLFSISMVFFRADNVSDAVHLIRCGFTKHISGLNGVIPEALALIEASGIRGLKADSAFGLTYIEMPVLFVSLVILLVVDIIKMRTDVRALIASRPVVIRFIIWFALLFFVILMGQYGPGYDAAAFIYQGF